MHPVEPSVERWATAVLAIAAAACVVAPVLVAVDAPTGPRVVAVLALFLLAPGAAVLGRRSGELGLVVALSLAIEAIGAQVVLWLGWHPEPATYALAVVCLAVLATRLLTGRASVSLRGPRV